MQVGTEHTSISFPRITSQAKPNDHASNFVEQKGKSYTLVGFAFFLLGGQASLVLASAKSHSVSHDTSPFLPFLRPSCSTNLWR